MKRNLIALTLVALTGCATAPTGDDFASAGRTLLEVTGKLVVGIAAGLGEQGGNSAVAASNAVRNMQHDQAERERAERMYAEDTRREAMADERMRMRREQHRVSQLKPCNKTNDFLPGVTCALEKNATTYAQSDDAPFAGYDAMVERHRADEAPGQSPRNADSSMDVRISVRGLRESFAHGASLPQIQALAALPKLIERAVLAETNADRKGRADIKAVHHLYAPLDIGGQLYRVKITVNSTRVHGEKFHGHEIASLDVSRAGALVHPTVKAGAARQARGNAISVTELLGGTKREDGMPFTPDTAPGGPVKGPQAPLYSRASRILPARKAHRARHNMGNEYFGYRLGGIGNREA